MKTPAELLAYLDEIGVDYDNHEHPSVFKVADGEDIKRVIPGVHTKNLFLKDAKGQLWLISAEGHAAIDLRRLRRVIGSARLSFASADLMEAVLGVAPGSVTAFALANDTRHQVRFVLDRDLAETELLNFHPLTNTATTTLSAEGLRRFLESIGVTPLVVDFLAMGVVGSGMVR